MISQILLKTNLIKACSRVFLWHLRYLIKHRVSALACGFYITSKCNFACRFCNIWRINPAFQFEFDKSEKIIKELGEMKLIYLSFSGGEPLLVPYIFDLLSLAKNSGILYTHLVSNGFLMDKTKAKEIRNSRLSEISFSLDGNENEHDANRGVKGAFKGVLSAIDLVIRHSPDTNIVLNTIIDPRNPGAVLVPLSIANRMRIKMKVQPLNMHPSFGGQINHQGGMGVLNHEQRKKLMGIIKILKHSPTVINSKAFLDNYSSFLFCNSRTVLTNKKCIFGYHHLEIFNNRIFPCLEGLGWERGFLCEGQGNGINGIFSSREYNKTVEGLKGCRNCSNNFYVCYYEPRLNFPIWNFIKTRSKCLKVDYAKE
jgi:sulfatase maturation enzyme AslB (radical SAM superfamily)